MNELSNLTKAEACEIIRKAISENWMHKDIRVIDGAQAKLESALRVALAHLVAGETTDLGTAVDAIFEMYRRNDSIDKSYRNAARFILSVVNKVPARYESYDDEGNLPSDLQKNKENESQ